MNSFISLIQPCGAVELVAREVRGRYRDVTSIGGKCLGPLLRTAPVACIWLLAASATDDTIGVRQKAAVRELLARWQFILRPFAQ